MHPMLEALNHHTHTKEDIIRLFSSIERNLTASYPTLLYSDVLATVYDRMARELGAKDAPSDPTLRTHTHAASVFAEHV